MGYIAVDLDGTLAEYNGWVAVDHIGAPIPLMVDRVKHWLSQGREVVIFTARVAEGPEALPYIQEWLRTHIGQELPISNVKDYRLVELWDDRAKQVIPNTGKSLQQEHDTLADFAAQVDVFLSLLMHDQIHNGYSLPYWVQSEIHRLTERRLSDTPAQPPYVGGSHGSPCV